jgi:beta-lactamase class D
LADDSLPLRKIFSMRKFLFAPIIPLLFAACSQNNVTEDDSLRKYFDSAKVKGSFGMFDNGAGHFTIYDLPRFRDSSYQPAATFDILQSLIAIQTGIIKDDTAILFSGQTLLQAFQSNDEKDFRELAPRIGKDTLKKWIDSLGYGNKDISGSLDAFWLNNHLKITSDEQLGLMKKLYFDQLPFFQHTQLLVRRMMQAENNANYQLRYKSGRGTMEDGHSVGWIVGWIEENKHPYFFVLNLESPRTAMDIRNTGVSIVKSILGQMGFFYGKK